MRALFRLLMSAVIAVNLGRFAQPSTRRVDKRSGCNISARAAVLPTAPANLKGMVLPSPQWWKENRDKVTERFNAWVIG